MKKYITKMRDFVETENFRRTIKVLGILALVLFIFQVGVFVGFRKASFYGEFGNNFRNNFGGPRNEFRGMMEKGVPNAHGAMGKVIDISLPTMVIAGDDGIEKIVSIGDKCLVRRLRDNIRVGDISVGDSVVVIGAPGKDGKIKAQLIRVTPDLKIESISTSTNSEII